jgi:hypothetical protein
MMMTGPSSVRPLHELRMQEQCRAWQVKFKPHHRPNSVSVTHAASKSRHNQILSIRTQIATYESDTLTGGHWFLESAILRSPTHSRWAIRWKAALRERRSDSA